MDVVHAKNQIKVTVHKNCVPDGTPGETISERCEYLVYLTVPKMGGDGLLIGVTETPEAAETIASALNTVFGFVHTHV